MPRHLAGSKFTSRHTTVIEQAEPLLLHAARLAYVSKIVLGPIEQIRSQSPRLKYKEVPAGLHVTLYSLVAMQTFYIYTSDKTKLSQELETFWSAL